MRGHPNLAEPDKQAYAPERLGAFIDGANLYSATRALGFEVDYRKLLDHFHASGRLVRAFYYTTIDEPDYLTLRDHALLDEGGYAMVAKPGKDHSMPRRRFDCEMAVELALDLMAMVPHLDHAILMSGDGEFRGLVDAVQRRGIRVTIVSTIRSTPLMIDDALRRQADRFIDLEDLAPVIGRLVAETCRSDTL